jgi:putative (di)nucleoside polyphosphate hydrolase
MFARLGVPRYLGGMNSFRPAKRRARHQRQRRLGNYPHRDAPQPRVALSQAAPRPEAPATRTGPTPAPSKLNPTEGAPKLRRNVGLVVRNAQGKVLAGLRAHASGDKAWQMPQGGIEGRELPATAAYRELREETGIDPRAVKLVREHAAWIDYILPSEMTVGRRFAGQTQKWFLFDYLEAGLPNLAKATDQEFEQLAWVEFDWLIAHVIAFRKPVYKEVKKAFLL